MANFIPFLQELKVFVEDEVYALVKTIVQCIAMIYNPKSEYNLLLVKKGIKVDIVLRSSMRNVFLS